MAGYVKLFRSLRDHWLWQDIGTYSPREAWLDLILESNWSPRKRLIAGELIMVDRGSLVASERWLSVRWKWSRNKVRKFLQNLEDDAMISRKKTTTYCVITLLNYVSYQAIQDDNNQEKDHGRTTEGPRKDHGGTGEGTKTEEGNKDKKENNSLSANVSSLSCSPNQLSEAEEARIDELLKAAGFRSGHETIPPEDKQSYVTNLKLLIDEDTRAPILKNAKAWRAQADLAWFPTTVTAKNMGKHIPAILDYKPNGAHSKSTTASSGTAGTLNEGNSSKYAGVGRPPNRSV